MAQNTDQITQKQVTFADDVTDIIETDRTPLIRKESVFKKNQIYFF